MVLVVLRALFVLLMAAAGWHYLGEQGTSSNWGWLSLPIALTIGVLLVCVDILSPRRKLAIFAGTFFGLMAGTALAYGLSFVVPLLVEEVASLSPKSMFDPEPLVRFIDLALGLICCYLAISFTLQTKEDFRFIIPYVEFSRQTKGPRPILLDTSVLIDSRIVDIAKTGIFDSQLIVPRFVLEELQLVADSGDRLRRNRGKRALDVVSQLRESRVDVIIYESTRDVATAVPVDQRLISLAKDLRARVFTNDQNLNKIAQLNDVDIININELALTLKPVVLPGEKLSVTIVKAGEEPGQGVGYLQDGTMVVVEHARQREKQEVEITVIRVLQTSAGRMIFGRPADPASGSSSAEEAGARAESRAASR